MVKFKAIVTEEVEKNRLLTVTGENKNDVPELSITESGGSPDFTSTGKLQKDQEVTVVVKNDSIWQVEAGEDIKAGSSVEAGDGGVIVTSSNGGFGYVSESVKKGDVAQVIRRASASGSGERGPRGYKGQDGFGTEKEYKDIIARLEALEKKEGE